jgi:anthranilate phosphoribosyltransferase
MGFPNTSSGGLLGGDIKEEAAWVVRVLSNKEEGGGLDIVLLNAGLGIYVSGKVSTVGEGAALAREALTTGAAAAKFVEVMQISREV